MIYNKPAVSIPDQITKLKARGLAIGDDAFAIHCLYNISYYRLRANPLQSRLFDGAEPGIGRH